MKQAYEGVYGDYGLWYLRKIEVLPKCKKVTKFGRTVEYQLVCRNVFFVFPYTYWLDKREIRWYDEPTVEYYDCKCGEE